MPFDSAFMLEANGIGLIKASGNHSPVRRNCIKKSPALASDLFMESGGDLLSRTVASQVPSALKSLTSVFGMGTGGTSSSLPPEIVSYLGNRFSFFPLGLPCQRFHRPFIGTGWPLPSSFSSSSGALGRFTHPDNCTATRIQEFVDLLVFLLP